MTGSTMITALTALAIATTSTLAVAQPRHDRDNDHDERNRRTSQPHADRSSDRGTERGTERPTQLRHRDQAGRHSAAQPHPQSAARSAPSRQPQHGQRGVGPQQRYHRGDHLPASLRNRDAWVQDWRYHRLPEPPRDYQWVKVGTDFVLVAVATGLIASIILGNR